MGIGIVGSVIESMEGDVYVVKTIEHGILRIPQDAVSDDSEVWKIGDAGMLMVEGWWAKQKKIRGVCIKKQKAEGGASIELTMKPRKPRKLGKPIVLKKRIGGPRPKRNRRRRSQEPKKLSDEPVKTSKGREKQKKAWQRFLAKIKKRAEDNYAE